MMTRLHFLDSGTTTSYARNDDGSIPTQYQEYMTIVDVATLPDESIGRGWTQEINTTNYPYGVLREITVIQISNYRTETDENGQEEMIERSYTIRYTTLQNWFGEEPPAGIEAKIEEEILVEVFDDVTLPSSVIYNIEYSKNADEGVDTQIETIILESTAKKLQGVISQWYFILRNFALLALMVILIYIGIRIVLGSTAGEKAKYKERMMDWLVAVCLIFIMNYIMAFAHTFVGYITQLIENVGDIDGILEYVPLTKEQLKNAKQIEGSDETEEVDSPFKETFSQNGVIIEGETNEYGQSQAYLGWTTNLMGKIKIRTQTVNEGTANWVGYSICYIVLVLETLFFSWTYLKRVVYMAFLTVIAPLVAMTYPIDKINDGKAQAFGMWLKEYIFNLLIQPLHLLLYTVLVTMAYQLATTNPFYAVVAVGFIMPAEKLLRKFFGFTKAQTPGMLSGAAGAALGFTGMQKLMRFGNKGKGREKDEKEESAKIKFSNKDRTNPREAVAKNAMNKNGGVGSQAKTSGDSAGKKADGTQTKAGGQTQAGATTKLRTKDTSAAKATTADATKGSKDKKEGRKMPKALSVAGRGFKTGFAAIKGYNRRLGIKNAKRMKKGRPIRALARGVAGVYGAAAFGMAGMALGVASGDPSKAFQYGTAGIAGGYSAGKGIAGSAVDAMTVDGSKVQDEMDMAWYGEEYKQKQLEREKESFAKNEKNIDYLRKTMNVSRSRAQEILRETGGQCLDSGVTDIADVAAIQKMSEAGVDIDQAIAAQRFNQYLPSDLDKMGEKERNDHLARWEKEYMQDGYENPRALAERSMELAEQFNKAKSSLKKA